MFFGVSVILGTNTDDSGSSANNNILFSSFSDAFYDSEGLKDTISRFEYLIFGSLGSRDIIVGDDDFLFDAGEYGRHYSYLEDYVGADSFSEVELEALANIINLRRVAYQNQGVDYLLAVIPNAQTVYSDYMPSYLGGIGETRLDQLSTYVEERGYECFLNTADVLKLSRNYSRDILYNNTENSLNSLGEWYVYSAVCDKLESLYGAEGSKVALSELDLYVSYTDGKTLARRAGLSSVIQNKTVSLSNRNDIAYTVENYYGSMVKTEKLPEYRTGGDCPVILMEFTDNWDRVQLMPYFSDTYDEVAYKSNHQFSGLVTENLKPDVVVQFIREYELYDMIDAGLCLTYNAGLNLSRDPYITATPILVASSQVSANSICIAGETEEDAVITVSGEGIETISQRAIGSLFFVEVDFGDKTSALVKISAKVGDKDESAPMSFSVTLSDSEREKTVAVGNNSQLYSTDYSAINFLSDDQISAVRKGLVEQLANIKNASGKETEYIYVVAPDKLSIYSADAPASLAGLVETVEDYKEMVGNIARSAGMTVIDLTDEMKAHNSLESTYCQTDMMWTGFGSYVGYHSLMAHISERFAAVKPHGLGDLIAVTEKNVGGELVTRLGIDGAVISESYLTLTLDIDSDVHFEQSGGGNFDITQAFISYNNTNNSELPVAIVTRDAYGTGMLDKMAEHFSKMVVLREGEFAVGEELCAEIKPDYIITIRCNGELS